MKTHVRGTRTVDPAPAPRQSRRLLLGWLAGMPAVTFGLVQIDAAEWGEPSAANANTAPTCSNCATCEMRFCRYYSK